MLLAEYNSKIIQKNYSSFPLKIKKTPFSLNLKLVQPNIFYLVEEKPI